MDHGRERRTHSMGSCVRAGGGLRGVGGAPDARAGGSVGGATPRAGAARAARGAAPADDAVKNDAVKNDAAEISTETSVRSEKENTRVPSSAVAIPPEAGTDVSASEQKRTPKPTSVSETVSEAPPFSVDAALARFDPTRARASAPIREDAFLSAAESAAAEAARLGPSARELYYASYKAAMQEATASLNRSDASAVLAAAAGAARSVRGASSEGASAGPSPSRVEPSPNPARRRATPRRRRRAAGGTAGPPAPGAAGRRRARATRRGRTDVRATEKADVSAGAARRTR